MLIFTRRLEPAQPLSNQIQPDLTLALTAEERSRSRHHRFDLPSGPLLLQLPRGTLLKDGDLLQTATGDTMLKIEAKPEPVLTVRASTPLDLLEAAYHLGNRHVPLEINADYLRLAPDPVLEKMLNQLGLAIASEIAPLHPIPGAYHSH